MLGLGSNNWLMRSYRRLRNYCDANGTTPWDTLVQLEAGDIRIPYAGALETRFTELKNEIGELEELAEENDLTPVIDHLFPDGDALVRDIRVLALETLASVDGDDRAQFLHELTRAITKPEIPSEIEDVRVMSLHKSKGLNAPVTMIAGCVEGLLPQQPHAQLPQPIQDAQLEEQRRLFYVGISRVKACPAEGKPGTLILTYSQQMPLATALGAGIAPANIIYGDAQFLPSRFISELGRAAPAPIAG